MPPSHRRRLRAFARTETGGAAVENALVLTLTAVMIYAVKTASGIASLTKPLQQAAASLLRALS